MNFSSSWSVVFVEYLALHIYLIYSALQSQDDLCLFCATTRSLFSSKGILVSNPMLMQSLCDPKNMGQPKRVASPAMFEQMGGLRYRELSWFAQGKKASQWQSED